MADSYFKMNGTTMIQRKSGIDSQFFHGPNHNFEIRAENSPITGTTNSSENNANSDQLAIYNGATKLWGINESGWLQNPNAPSFSVGMTSSPSDANDSVVTNYNIIYHNIGGHLDTTAGKFTAPIDGRYFFSFHAFCQTGGDTASGLWFRVNGSNTRRIYSSEANTYRPWTIVSIIQLSAGDYVEVYTGLDLHDNDSNFFSGHLIG
jgi:hypothetical protein